MKNFSTGSPRSSASVPTEESDCRALTAWMTLKGLLFSHVPQETYTKSWGVKARNRAMGVRRGVPDYLVVVRGSGASRLVFVEMKRKGSPPSAVKDEQRTWLNELSKVPGVTAAVCRGFDEAERLISEEIKKYGG